MNETNLIEKLKTSEFFRGFEDDHLQRLSAICQLEKFPARSTVFEEYERARKVYVILSGEISLAICEPDETCKQIAVVRAGDLMVALGGSRTPLRHGPHADSGNGPGLRR